MKTIKRGEKTIGLYDPKKNLIMKNVWMSRHFFRLGREWGIDYFMLSQIPDDATVVLHEMENDDWYWLTKKEIMEKGKEMLGYSGYGLQRMVRVEDWNTLTEVQKEENIYRKVQGLGLRYIPGQ